MKFKGGCHPITHPTLMDPPMEHKVHFKTNKFRRGDVLTLSLHQLDPPTLYRSIMLLSQGPVLRSAKRAPSNVRRLNNSSDVIFYCSVGERSRALALLNAALDRGDK